VKLIVKSPVWKDLRAIGLRIKRDNPDAADRFLTAAEESFELLRRHPAIGRLRSFSLPGVRSWVLPDFQKYIVFYLPTSNEVQILAVLHGARDVSTIVEGRI
jgi:toxin ParE1/3/4